MADFTGQNIIVLGATGGIGSQLAKSLASQGANVLGIGRSEDKLSELASESGIKTTALDATDGKALESSFTEFIPEGQALNGVVNCIGSIMLKPAHLLNDDDWQSTMQTNLTTSFHCVRSAAKLMRSNGGSIVLIATTASHIGLPNHEAIAAAKHGVIGLMQSAAASYVRNKIRVNVVSPGLVETPLTERLTSNPKALEISLKNHPLGRIGQPNDIARGIEFFLDPRNDWITGQALAIDGGCSSIKV